MLESLALPALLLESRVVERAEGRGDTYSNVHSSENDGVLDVDCSDAREGKKEKGVSSTSPSSSLDSSGSKGREDSHILVIGVSRDMVGWKG